eukprot:3474929-Amphidinium_carterae.1
MSLQGKGVPTFSICSNPTTPREVREGREEDEWENVCCLCSEIMQPEDLIACARCTHQCHKSCKYVCNGDVVCGHCKFDHFRKDQIYNPPMSQALLLTNIENGVAVEGGDRILQLEYQRVEVLAGLAGSAEQRGSSSMAAGMAISVPGSVEEVERESRPAPTGAACGVLSPAAPMESSTATLASLRTSMTGKRGAEELPPGLESEIEVKARRTEEKFSYHIEQHVVMLQAVVQKFEVHGRCELNQEQLQEIWRLIQEIAGHLHSVAHFAGQGLAEQGANTQAIRQVVGYLDSEVAKCRALAGSAARATEKQDDIMSKFRTRLEKIQSQTERMTSLLDGITTPVKEVFSQNYDARIQLDGLTARMIQLEENGINDQLNEVINAIWNQQDLTGPQSPFREGPTLIDRIRKLQDDKTQEIYSWCNAADVQLQALHKEVEKFKTGLGDRQEKFEGDQRVEVLKIR